MQFLVYKKYFLTCTCYQKRPAQTSDAPMYINVQASKQIGFENPQDNSFYQELLPVGFAKPENSTTTVKTEDNNYQTLCGIQTTEPQLSQDCLQGELGALEVIYYIYLLFYVAFNSQGHIVMGSLQVGTGK